MRSVFLLCLVIALIGCLSTQATPKNKANAKASAKAKPARLNVDVLPPLQQVLEELDLSAYLRDFVRMGVTESRLLLKLGAMDFQIMGMDWADFSKDKEQRLRRRIEELYRLALVPEEDLRPELELRKKLTYGRVYVPQGVQSFEYSLASFGGAPPLGSQPLTLSRSLYECNTTGTENYENKVVIVKRGNCTFLHKALNLKANNASGMLVVSFEDRLESPSSGYGVDKSISEQVVNSLGDFFVIQTANTTWESLRRVVSFHESEGRPPTMHVVPLKCHTGGHCAPLSREEIALRGEVSWGRLRVLGRGEEEEETLSRSFDFLTSNFGAHLPVGRPLPVVFSSAPSACEPIQNISSALLDEHRETGVAMIAQRGSCRFDVKAMHAQNAGARVLIVYDPTDQALQRLGGMLPELPFVSIPAVLTSSEVAQTLREGDFVEFLPSNNDRGFEHWLEIAHTEWSENQQERLMQLEGMFSKFQETEFEDITRWLRRRIDEITTKTEL